MCSGFVMCLLFSWLCVLHVKVSEGRSLVCMILVVYYSVNGSVDDCDVLGG